MTGGVIRGWCPGALRPMETGDGLVVRIRPHGSRLTQVQAHRVADLAQVHGSGLIDLGSRAHIQLRGVRESSLTKLHDALADLGLLDPDPLVEARRNILTTPIWADDETSALVTALEAALALAPSLPPKFGFAVDTGAAAVLTQASADIRIERSSTGLILRADGMPRGEVVSPADAAQRAVDLAQWFADHRGAARRMSPLLAAGTSPPLSADQPPLLGPPLVPGRTTHGLCIGLPFGQIDAPTLRALASAPLRLTPWRSVVVEGVLSMDIPAGLIADPFDPLLRVAACTGAPGCASASVSTRTLARDIAPLIPEGFTLHVSGCAKGCAHPSAADLTATGTAGRFDLVENGSARDTPFARALTPDELLNLLRGRLAP